MFNQHYTYLLIDLVCISIPLLASFHPKSPFYKEWKWFLPANLVVAVAFLIWDILFTKQGVWGFNEAYITGIKLYNLPIEEILFFICIPYACTYTFYVCHKYMYVGASSTKLLSYVLMAVLLVLAILNINKAYTATTFMLLAGVLLYIESSKASYLANFYLVYVVMLVPFFISNGLLTGTWLNEPVVWYNNGENLGIRLGTIPVEDTMYGMLLLLLNVSVYRWLKNKLGNSQTKQTEYCYRLDEPLKQETMQNDNDQVILVNEHDEWVGATEKMKAHKEGLLHRAFSVFIMNSNNEVLLHQRALDKYHSGGLWTNACCSHPRVGESTLAGAHRRLREEMGFDCAIEEVFTYMYKADVGGGLTEHEYDHIYFGYYDGNVDLNKKEVKDYKYLPIAEVTSLLEIRPNDFTQWFRMIWPDFLKYKAGRKKVA